MVAGPTMGIRHLASSIHVLYILPGQGAAPVCLAPEDPSFVGRVYKNNALQTLFTPNA